MRFHLIRKNLGRKKVRTLFTGLSILIAFLLYGLLTALSKSFSIGLDLAGSSEVLSVEVVDSSGRVVATAANVGSLPRGLHELDWAEFDAEPPPGLHSLRVTVAPGDPTPELLVRSTVTGAALDASGTVLLMGDAEVPLSSLREIGNGPIREL